VRLQQVVEPGVLAVFVLDPDEHRELVPWAKVHLELSHSVHDMVVHAFGVRAPGVLLTRPPVALEDVPGMRHLRDKLRVGLAGRAEESERDDGGDREGGQGQRFAAKGHPARRISRR
jgi:hypothetical protein